MRSILLLARVVWLDLLRRKEAYVLLILGAGLLVWLSALDSFSATGLSYYLLDTGLSLAWLFAWVVTLSGAARQIPEEERRGTIYPLLAKPVTRFQFIMGKWLGAWSSAAAANLVFYGLVLGMTLARGGRVGPGVLVQAFTLHTALLGILTALALALSTRLNRDAAATLSFFLSFAAFAVAPKIPVWMNFAEGLSQRLMLVLYYALPHFELFDLRTRVVHGWGVAPWGLWAMTLAYAACWTGLLLGAAWAGYRAKQFRREVR